MNWTERTFRDWLDEHGQTDRTRTLFWDPIIVSARNLDCEHVAAVHGIQVFQEAFPAQSSPAAWGCRVFRSATFTIRQNRSSQMRGARSSSVDPFDQSPLASTASRAS